MLRVARGLRVHAGPWNIRRDPWWWIGEGGVEGYTRVSQRLHERAGVWWYKGSVRICAEPDSCFCFEAFIQ